MAEDKNMDKKNYDHVQKDLTRANRAQHDVVSSGVTPDHLVRILDPYSPGTLYPVLYATFPDCGWQVE